MSSPALNNAATTDAYSEANTVIFTYPKRGFALHVFNAAIYYQLAIPGASGQQGSYTWDSLEHYIAPSLSSFDDPASEGFPGATGFAGCRVRSAAVGVPANVSII